MKRVILAFCLLHSLKAICMDAPLRRSSSSSRSGTLMVRHQRHKSVGDQVSAKLLVKNDESVDCAQNIDALITPRRSTTCMTPETSQNSPELPHKSSLRNLTEKAGEE